MTKEKLTELIQQYKTENEIETLPLGDMFEYLPDIAHFLEENVSDIEFVLSMDSVMGESDSYCMCTTYSMAISKPIIMNWYTRTSYENEAEFIEYIYNLNVEAILLLARIK